VERRRCSVVADLSLLDHAAEWAQLSSLVRIQAERYHKATGKTERETRYYDGRQLEVPVNDKQNSRSALTHHICY
jgi:hypothetical protein